MKGFAWSEAHHIYINIDLPFHLIDPTPMRCASGMRNQYVYHIPLTNAGVQVRVRVHRLPNVLRCRSEVQSVPLHFTIDMIYIWDKQTY